QPAAQPDTNQPVYQRLGRWLAPLISLVLFALAILVIHGQLAAFRPSELLGHLKALPAHAVAPALLAAALGYGTLTLFDPLALRFLGKRLPYRRGGGRAVAGVGPWPK